MMRQKVFYESIYYIKFQQSLCLLIDDLIKIRPTTFFVIVPFSPCMQDLTTLYCGIDALIISQSDFGFCVRKSIIQR